jgi:hypothetical protein
MGGKSNPGGLEHDTRYTDGIKSIFCAWDQVRRRKNTTIEKIYIWRDKKGPSTSPYFTYNRFLDEFGQISSCCYIVNVLYTIICHELRHARKAWSIL